MDQLVGRESLSREGVPLNEVGALLRSEIEEAVHRMPDRMRLDLGRRKGDRRCVMSALDLAQRLYAGEDARDDNSPAVNHIVRVAHRVAVRYTTNDATLIMAATLHDAVEDHPETLARLGDRSGKDDHADAVRFVKRVYGHAVGNLVDKVSKRKNEKLQTPDAKILAYTAYVQRLTRDPSALIVKIADVCDNVTNPRPIENGGHYSMKKYAFALPILLKGLERHKTLIVKRWGTETYNALKTDVEGAQTFTFGFLLSAPVSEG
jgi:hypothetical protein